MQDFCVPQKFFELAVGADGKATRSKFEKSALFRLRHRAAAGMIDLIRKGFFKKDETVLFLHTGGQPALFADEYASKI